MEILGDGRPDEPRPNGRPKAAPPEEVLSEDELLGLDPADANEDAEADEDAGPAAARRRTVGAEALAVAAAVLALAAVMGRVEFYSTLRLYSTFDEGPSWGSSVWAAAGLWAPGLLAMLLGLLAVRSDAGRTSWARPLALGSVLAVAGMVLLVFLGMFYDLEVAPDVPERF
ncbi:hypothetical protein [Motilibacter aurantiacus]|uniref:hypothetical protein n=1 Tax=Motilibacter aurantiacus TaxID=2714955 RepID=UPI001408DA78|nr:hypothetical protein [Motilibacter aurantiacus]NHC45606.1 hypothetical protein [Motilibacter aurantiacus]